MSAIADLAARQLEAYNASNLDDFVACYHPDVRVFDGDDVSLEGLEQFRQRYQDLFRKWRFGATVPQRLTLNGHCIDYEEWWRVNPENGERTEGRIIVRYELKDKLIGTVQFLR